jgi:hypothetical protein
LQRGQTYLYTARIENDGWPLMVTAEEGDGPLPIIKPLVPLQVRMKLKGHFMPLVIFI